MLCLLKYISMDYNGECVVMLRTLNITKILFCKHINSSCGANNVA